MSYKRSASEDYVQRVAADEAAAAVQAVLDEVRSTAQAALSTANAANALASEVSEACGRAAMDLKANKSEMSVTPGTGADADKTTIQLKDGTSATVLMQHQDISGKADASALRYDLAAASVALDTTENTDDTADIELLDRTMNSAAIAAPGNGSTATVNFILPEPITGKARDFMLTLTFGSDAGDEGDISLSFVEPTPESGTAPEAVIDFGSVEDVAIGKNLILFTEIPAPAGVSDKTFWLVTVKHEDFA